ncbi:TerB family tellurite resistance protein [Halorubellus sp. PRR65]|uniref:TerB family tellurite resistance protein n=1 Tax=Halorubellus sp. PRR65 TaxID=3098148 RepID=UPI002B2600A5|nr:TerB family tellurite resistance protein [Halorubellus sp. PRR65]
MGQVLGASLYLVLPLVLFGYWVTMYDARLGGALAGYALGVGVGMPVSDPVALGAGVALAAVFAGVAHYEARFGWAVVGGATGLLLGGFALGGVTTPVGAGAGLALAVVLGALAWKFPRGTLPLSTGVLGALFVATALTAGADSGGGDLTNVAVTAVVLGGFVALMIQPWTAELGDTVPPLLPLRVRNWFDLVTEGGVDDAVCPNCGQRVDPNAPYCGNCDASLAGMVGPADGAAGDATETTVADVPDDAVAVDVPCPECGERPIEEAATGVGLVGMLLAYQWSSRTVMGCHACNRSRLWGLAGKNLLLGWWSIASLFANPFTVLWNLGRGAVNRGPSTKLARTLAESGVDFQYLADPSEFDASEYGEHELLKRGLLRLGVAVMLADGRADKSEAAAIRDNALELFPDADRNELQERVTEYANGTTNAAKVADGLEETLTRDGRQLALRFAAQVAVADGDVDDAEAELLATLADELELDDGAVQNAIGSGVSTEGTPDPSAAL